MIDYRKAMDSMVVERGGVAFSPRVTSAKRDTPYYISFQSVMPSVAARKEVAETAYSFAASRGFMPDCFIGVPEGATLLAAEMNNLIAYRQPEDVPSVCFRAAAKAHGDPSDRYFIGSFEPGTRFALVEDVVSTGGSLLLRARQLIEAGAGICCCIAVVDRLEISEYGEHVSEVLRCDCGIPYAAITDASTLLPLAFEKLKPPGETASEVEYYYEKYGIAGFRLPRCVQ